MAARVGSTLVDRLSSTNSTPSTVPTGWSRWLRCSKPTGGGAQRGVVAGLGHAQRVQAGPGDQRVAPVVRAEQAQRRHPVGARVIGRVHPA